MRPIRVPARNKRVWASVERDAVNVIEEAFKEALQRDPKQLRQWVVLIDGHPAQRKMIEKAVKKYQVNITVVLDFIHVLEYLWKAVWCFFKKEDEAVEKWVADYALKIKSLKAIPVRLPKDSDKVQPSENYPIERVSISVQNTSNPRLVTIADF